MNTTEIRLISRRVFITHAVGLAGGVAGQPTGIGATLAGGRK